ncbi:MAG: hypothetical protein K2X93_03180 [Candidatus Obscuribacterales bacterium]|nr:hypothetical protein [Candidatus Obscuribacterales bacterium]
MFACLLVLAEMCLLATVFWYVFVREPRPFEITDNLWGCYDQPLDAVTGYGAADQSNSNSQVRDESRMSRNSRQSMHQVVLLRSSRHGVKRKKANIDLKNGWVESDQTRPSGLVANALSGIAEKLNQLSMMFS